MRALNLHHIADPSLPIPGEDPWIANPGDPAVSVMTDFRERPSVTVVETASIDAALSVIVFKAERDQVRVQANALNLTNRLNVINFAGLFSGTALAPPRSFGARVHVEF